MKTKRYSVVTTKDYWSCHDQDHRHVLQRAAQECIDRHLRGQKQRKWTEERLHHMMTMRDDEKMTFKSMAEVYGISISRARHLYRRAVSKYGQKTQRPVNISPWRTKMRVSYENRFPMIPSSVSVDC